VQGWESKMAKREDYYQIADELRAIANLGLRYTEQGYDKERFKQVLELSARLLSVVDHSPLEEIKSQYRDNLAHLSPVVTVESVVLRDEKILLIQRSDDHLWAVPGGLAEVGETTAQAAERELWEEAGIHGKVEKLLGLYDSRYWPTRTRMQLAIMQFLIQSDEIPLLHDKKEAQSAFAEALDVRFFDESDLPPLSFGHEKRIGMAFKIFRGELNFPYFDR
jgi:8-oxo-dGTP pyrophosphatase MutT (NUDIX family)